MKRRILSILVTLAMLVCMLPVDMLAEGLDVDIEQPVGDVEIIEAEPPVGDGEDGEIPLTDPTEEEEAALTVVYRFYVGEELVAEQTVADGDVIQMPDDPEAPEGEVFVGWFIGEYQLFAADVDEDEIIDPEIALVGPLSTDVDVLAVFEKVEEAEEPTDTQEGL